MAYIGREPAYGAFSKQTITADSSTTTFTLNFVVGSTAVGTFVQGPFPCQFVL